MIFNNMFKHADVIKKGLDANWLRQEVIANNLANVDTPGFKSSRVDFEEAFRAAVRNSNGTFENKKTRRGHIDFSDTPDLASVKPVVVKNNHYTMRMDGNNVDPDLEMTELAKSTIMYNTLIDKLSREFSRMKDAITSK